MEEKKNLTVIQIALLTGISAFLTQLFHLINAGEIKDGPKLIEAMTPDERLAELIKKRDEAVIDQRYEEAARYRDEINNFAVTNKQN